jgi:outer membrane protein TolC
MRLRCAVLTLLALSALPTHATAPEPDAPYRPPRFDAGDGTIDLTQALRLSLANDPNLLLSREDEQFQRGVLGELSGAFDWVLGFDLSYDHREQELRDSVIQGERDKRDELSALNRFACGQVPEQQAKIDAIDRALGGSVNPDDFSQNTDAFFQAQLTLIQTRLANATTQAEIDALTRSRTALLTRERGIALVARDEARFTCDESRTSLDRLGSIPEFEEFDGGQVSLQLAKLFRTGVFLQPFVDASYDHTQFKGKENGFFEPRLDAQGNPVLTEFGTPLQRFVDFGGKNVEDLYKAGVGFDLNLPLLRGRGVESTGAPERAAEVDLEASGLALRHAATVTALNTTVAYWALLGAQERVQVLERSLALQGSLVELTDQLIEGDQVPRVERARSLAGQANARAQLESARRDLVTARLALARTMGVELEGTTSPPLAAGPFPAPPTPEALGALDTAAVANDAVERRFDRAATHRLVESGKVLAVAARRDLADRLDLLMTLSADALGEESFSNATDRWTGPSGSIALEYEKEIGKRTAKGRLGQREAVMRQRQISAADLDRTIRLGVVELIDSLAQAVARLRAAEAADGYFQETIEAEVEKLKAGASTLVDTILTEQQRTSSSLALIAARQQVVTLLAQLAFEAGTIVDPDDAGGNVQVDRLVGLPPSGGVGGAGDGGGGQR